MRLRRAAGAAALALALVCAAAAQATPLDEPAPLLSEPERAPLFGATRFGTAVVAVGDRGLVLRGMDGSWEQEPLGIRQTLTAVAVAGDGRLVAVGHDAVVLESSDANAWSLVRSDPDLDAPLLDLWFGADGHGFAVGAYGLVLETRDHGRTWTSRSDVDPTESHLYAVREGPGGDLFIVGEFGTILRSGDSGATWTALTAGTEATFFGIRSGPRGRLLLHGLSGRLYESRDAGESWTRLEIPTTAGLYDLAFLSDGRTVVAGGNGTLLVEAVAGEGGFQAIPLGNRKAVSSVLPMEDGTLLLFGDGGQRALVPPFGGNR